MASRLATILVIVIVGATLIAGLIVGAQRDDASGPVDLIIVNGKVYPGAGAAVQEAVAVRGNQILRVGSNREVKRLRRAQTVVVDAHGATVIPGFNDAHVRLIDGALALERLDLSSAFTIDDIETEIDQYADDMPARSWVLGRNGDTELFATANLAARKILDDDVADRPVLLSSADGKIAWANSKALEKAGITGRTRAPQGGTIVKDRRTGQPTGVLKASAIDLMTRVLPQPSHAEKILALRAAIEEAHQPGITSLQFVSSDRADLEEMDLLDEIRQQGDLTIRVYGSLAVSPDVTEEAVLALDKLRQEYPDDPKLKLGGVLMVCPCDATKLERAVALLDRHNWQVMVRASDPTDTNAVLVAFEHAASGNPAPSRERRYRIDDGEAIRLWNGVTDAGARLLFGSNWPALSFDPREVIEDAVTPESTDLPARSVRSVIDAYTSQAAYASYDELRKGTLARGMLADIVILSNDIFQDPPQSVRDTAVTVTIFDGKIVYQHPVSTSN